MTVEEVACARVHLPEDPEKHPNLDRGEVDVGMWHRAPCTLEHGAKGAGAYVGALCYP